MDDPESRVSLTAHEHQQQQTVMGTEGISRKARYTTPFWAFYIWLEAFAVLYYLALAGVLAFSAVHGFGRFKVGLWYGPQVLFPVSFITTIFFVGPPPNNIHQTQELRHKLHSVVAAVGAMLSAGAGVVFIILAIVYVASSGCNTDPASVCQGHLFSFAVMLALCAFLVVVALLSLYVVCASWYAIRPHAGSKRRL